MNGGDSTGGWEDMSQQVVTRCEPAAVMTPQFASGKKKRAAGIGTSFREVKRLAKAQEKEAKKSAKEADFEEKKEEVSKKVDQIVGNFQPDYRKCINCQDEKHPRNKQDDTDYSVAKWLVLKEGKPEEQRYDIADFNHQQLLILATKCKLKGSGSMSMWKARVDPREEDKHIMRIIQTCFHPTLVQRFVDLNDRNKRKQFEENSGRDPVKAFMVEVSNMYNDSSMNEVLSKIVNSNSEMPDSDVHLVEWVDAAELNLNDFEPQTHQTVHTKVYDLMKARELALGGMTKFGNHASDFWTYATNPAYLKWRANGSPLPAKAVYYTHILCKQYPGIDGKFAAQLATNMKSDSHVPMTGDAGAINSNGSGRKSNREVVKKMDEATQQIKDNHHKAFLQRQEYIDLQKAEAKRKADTDSWHEYTRLSKEFRELKRENDSDNDTMLSNMAVRIRNIEKAIDIHNSIAHGEDMSQQVVTRCEPAAVMTPQFASGKKKRAAGIGTSFREVKRLAKAQEKEAKKSAKEADLKKKEEVSKKVDQIVGNFQPDYRKCINCQDEKHPRNKQDDTDYSVAKWLVLKEGKPEEQRYDIADFNHQQLLILATKCKLKGSGSMSMWKARVDPREEDKHIMRIIQTCFHPTLVQRFVDLNDRNKRKQFEENSGRDPVKAFMVEVSNMYNDSSMNEVLSKIVNSNSEMPDSDVHLVEWVDAAELNLNDFEPQTHQTVHTKVYDLMKARELALGGMTKFGNHASDFWTYATNPAYLKWRANGSPLPAKAVYYTHILCKQYPGIDGKFAAQLATNMKSDSHVPMTGDAGAINTIPMFQ
ncbi:unknown protein [Seminavis robusta]|uniref:Uncharacterized protein n=1 Tax=Seminavis robusta TaxID=568900 RepID=A0A9N8HQU1_9STRA|nr:unknown protein [Seminavis robusta]|eukprot:Sro1194_g251330.1 n/a (818) ;mRNA; r:30112-32828